MAITIIHNALLPTDTHPQGIEACVVIDGDRISAVYTADTCMADCPPCGSQGWGAASSQNKQTSPNSLENSRKFSKILESIRSSSLDSTTLIDARGAMLLPGVIDCHVHFRDPGLTHKGDIATESLAAVAGGVTSYIDMPNTKPPTVTRRDLLAKHAEASRKSIANYGFFIGATDDNLDELLATDYHTEAAGVKVFMGSSTGNMLVDDPDTLDTIFSTIKAPIVVHAEDQRIIAANSKQQTANSDSLDDIATHARIRSAEACLSSTTDALMRAMCHGTRLHIAHLTTAAELYLITALNSQPSTLNSRLTCEVSPLHLTFTDADYARLGTKIKVNPAVKTTVDRDALRRGVRTGTIDIIATDHAPHLPDEKQGNVLTAASGAPSLQYSLPLMLTLFDDPRLVALRMAEAPAECFGIKDRGRIAPGMYADIVLVERTAPYPITADSVKSRCGWTPYEGMTLGWRVAKTFVNGHLVYDADTPIPTDTLHSMPLEYL